jgi:hypothetical protein
MSIAAGPARLTPAGNQPAGGFARQLRAAMAVMPPARAPSVPAQASRPPSKIIQVLVESPGRPRPAIPQRADSRCRSPLPERHLVRAALLLRPPGDGQPE